MIKQLSRVPRGYILLNIQVETPVSAQIRAYGQNDM